MFSNDVDDYIEVAGAGIGYEITLDNFGGNSTGLFSWDNSTYSTYIDTLEEIDLIENAGVFAYWGDVEDNGDASLIYSGKTNAVQLDGPKQMWAKNCTAPSADPFLSTFIRFDFGIITSTFSTTAIDYDEIMASVSSISTISCGRKFWNWNEFSTYNADFEAVCGELFWGVEDPAKLDVYGFYIRAYTQAEGGRAYQSDDIKFQFVKNISDVAKPTLYYDN